MAGICGVLLVTQCQGDRIFCLFHLLIHHKTKCCWFFFSLFLKALFLNYTYISLGKPREKSDVRHT